MRILVKIGSASAILSIEQLAKLTELLSEVEVLHNEWVGKAINPTGYIDKIKPMDVKEMLDLKIMPQVEDDALTVFTELSKEAK